LSALSAYAAGGAVISSIGALELFDLRVPGVFNVVNGIVIAALLYWVPGVEFVTAFFIGFGVSVCVWALALWAGTAAVRKAWRRFGRKTRLARGK
jgi:hypothetical protein